MSTTESTRRGRPRGFDPDEAVEAALPLFRARGYEAVGVAELAEAVGVAPPSLYAAFGSKRGLFERVLDLYTRREGARAAEAFAGADRAADALRAGLITSARATLAGGARGCLVMDGARHCGDPEVSELVAAAQRGTREAIRARVARERADLADAIADFSLVVLRGLSAAARDGASLEALEQSARLAADAIEARLAAPRARAKPARRRR